MQPEKVKQEDGKAFVAMKVNVEKIVINKEYELRYDKQKEISGTGLLAIFELLPKQDSMPRFIGRWDNAFDALDIDGEYSSGVKLPKDGFIGHHTERINCSGRVFQVNIVFSNETIFKGRVSFNLEKRLTLTENVELS